MADDDATDTLTLHDTLVAQATVPYDFQIVGVDTAILPPLLLPLAKAQVRVNFADDDAILTQYIGNAIEIFEFVSGQRINKTEAVWKPVIVSQAISYACPVQPVKTFEVLDADLVDVSLQYVILRGTAVQPQYLTRRDRTPIPVGTMAALTAGYVMLAEIPPGTIGAVLRVTATLYENRETVTTPINYVPGWLNDLIVGNWIPRA